MVARLGGHGGFGWFVQLTTRQRSSGPATQTRPGFKWCMGSTSARSNRWRLLAVAGRFCLHDTARTWTTCARMHVANRRTLAGGAPCVLTRGRMAFPRWPMARAVLSGNPSGLDSGRYSGAAHCHPIFALILPATYVFCLVQLKASIKTSVSVAISSRRITKPNLNV
jgi:hypothetical protein